MNIPLDRRAESGRNNQGRECYQHAATFNRNAPKQEARMADKPNIIARGDSASNTDLSTWKSIGDLARQIAESGVPR